MATEIRVPTLGESVSEATVGQWFKRAGEAVDADEPVVELETDKVTIEVPAPIAGVLSDIVVNEGETVEVGALLGAIAEGDGAAAGNGKPPAAVAAEPEPQPVPEQTAPPSSGAAGATALPMSPAVRKMVAEHGLDADAIKGTGKDGRLTKEDVRRAVEEAAAPKPAPAEAAPQPATTAAAPPAAVAPPAMTAVSAEPPLHVRGPVAVEDEAREERVRMSRLRQTIAQRLKDAQNTAAMLTTFNEVDMTAVMALREEYRTLFERRHGTRLGIMGFFVKACVQALRDVPEVNAEMDGADIVFKNYYHIGIAVGTDKGLVVPVVRDAQAKTLPQVEAEIAVLGARAREGELAIEEMQGGTFTITNGGVYGSLMSTPILNAPQSGILGMHKVQQRPMVIDGEVQVRPMMYLALSYDHRVVDGQGAVSFLVRVKECLEDPQRMVLDL